MITGSSTRERSLVEQKRMQWQKEREELDRIGTEIFSHSQTQKFERTSIKTYFSNVDLSLQSPQYEERLFQPHFPSQPPPQRTTDNGGRYNNNNNNYGFNGATPLHSQPPPPPNHHPMSRAMRSPSLPPIPNRDKFYNYPHTQTLILNPVHLDTGYHSESSPMTNHDGPVEVWTNEDDDGRGSNKTVTLRSRNPSMSRSDLLDGRHHHQNMTPDSKPLGTPNSLSSGQTFSSLPQSVPGGTADYRGASQQRRKWNDTPQPMYYDQMARSVDSRSSHNVPYWLEKGLHDMRDSEDESTRSHIRGQNIPLDPDVIAERASRRRKAMELQNAIKEQLLEQERMKKWEKEKRLQEELLAEEKLRKQVEAERERLEYEKRVQDEKADNERRKAEIMRLAVEKAELEARLEKEKRRKQMRTAHEESPVEETRSIRVDAPIQMEGMRPPQPVQDDQVEPDNPPIEISVLPLRSTPTPTIHEMVTTNKSTDIDGIALVLQSITPMVPLANMGHPQDFLGLNNSVNNLQFALLLAQQQQQLNMQARQLNTISSASSNLSTTSDGTAPVTVREEISHRDKVAPIQSQMAENKPVHDGKECVYCCRIHGGRSDIAPVQDDQKKENEGKKESPLITFDEVTNKPEEIVDTESSDQIDQEAHLSLDVPKIPTDGTFIKDELITLDTETATQTDGELSSGHELVTWDMPRILTPRKYRVSSASSRMLVATHEIGIQTDLLLLENCNICTHKQQLVLKEISQVTTSVTQTSSSRKPELSPIRNRPCIDPSKDDQNMTMTTVTTTTTIRAKANERSSRHGKKEPRPKWGVNQPAFQYVKASDRDPFCISRRRKNQVKGFSMDQDEEVQVDYRKKVDSGVSSNNGSLHSMDLYEDSEPVEPVASRRNMCTEILPIKTDGNGQVFVNFREARLVQKDELMARNGINNGSQSSPAVREKIMEKRSEDLPFIPSVFRTERTLTKSASDSNYLPSTTPLTGNVSKGDKEEINFYTRNEM